MSNITDSVFFGGLLCALGVIFINVAIKKRNRLRKTQDTQRTKVSSAQQGYVEIEGFAWPDFETVESSSGLKTIHHSLQIQRLESVGRSKHWRTIFTKIHNITLSI